MLLYLDSSVALRAALPGPARKSWRQWIDDAAATHDALVSARLLRTEIVRVLRREDVPLVEGTRVLSRIRLIALTDQTFVVAESIERHVTTLDALHLATALVLGRPLRLATHDATMAEVATALGLATFDPVGEDNRPITPA